VTPPAGRFVVDASVAIKWIIEEDGSDAALALRGLDLAAPALFRTEIATVLRTIAARQEISEGQARELFAFLQTAPVVIMDHDEELEGRALELALSLQHPIYDCVYLALAERLDCRLVTADRRFLQGLTARGEAKRAVSLAELARGQPRAR